MMSTLRLFSGPAGFLAMGAILCLLLVSADGAREREEEPRVEKIRIKTDLVDHPVRVHVWLPAGADEAAHRSIPLLVFLHDGYGSQRSFVRKGLSTRLGEAIRHGELTPLVVASPRTVGSFNSNNITGTRRIEDFLSSELVPRLLERYPILRSDRAGLGVTGLSLGGYGSLKLAVKYPGLFGSASSMSTWIEDLSFEYQEDRFWLMRLMMRRRFGKERETNTLSRESLFKIIPEAADASDGFPPLLLVSGEDDPWVVNGNHRRLEKVLSAAGIEHTVRLHPGEHEWDFWRERFLELVRFHTAVFDETGLAAEPKGR